MKVRGTRDLFGIEYELFNKIKNEFNVVANRYDASFIHLSALETKEVVARTSGADSDIVSKEMFFVSHISTGNTQEKASGNEHDNIILKPEGTASAIRALYDLGIKMQEPLRIAYADRMYRYCRPQKGRLREFHQVGIEFFGSGYLIDIEAIAIAVDFLKSLHLLEYVTLNINTIGGPESRAEYAKALYIYFNQHKDAIEYLHTNPLRTLDKLSEDEKSKMLDMPSIYDYLTENDKKYFENVLDGLKALGINFKVNNSIIRGLDYYSHVVFEFTTQSTTAQNTVLAGGRYDKLIEEISNINNNGDRQSNSAIGWAAGIERLMLLHSEFIHSESYAYKQAVALINLECDQYALTMCQRLRMHVSVNIISVNKLKKGLDMANKLGYVHVVVCGENEIQSGKYMYKNLSSSEQKILNIEELIKVLCERI